MKFIDLFADEIWKPMPYRGYENIYQVSNYGRVKGLERIDCKGSFWPERIDCKGSFWPERIVKGHNTKKGYLHVDLRLDGKRRTVKVHRAVALAFLSNPANKPQVNHIDGNKKNNRVGNLEWATNGENQIHAYANNLKVRSEKAGKPKRRVAMFCIKTGKSLAEFDSLKGAQEETGVQYVNIRKVCVGERRYAGGFKWKFIQGDGVVCSEKRGGAND